MMNIVLDTNCLLMSLSRRSRYYPVYYHLHLITADPDDDKFVDCAFKANAKYIVTLVQYHY